MKIVRENLLQISARIFYTVCAMKNNSFTKDQILTFSAGLRDQIPNGAKVTFLFYEDSNNYESRVSYKGNDWIVKTSQLS